MALLIVKDLFIIVKSFILDELANELETAQTALDTYKVSQRDV